MAVIPESACSPKCPLIAGGPLLVDDEAIARRVVGRKGDQYFLLDFDEVLAFRAEGELVWVVTKQNRYHAAEAGEPVRRSTVPANPPHYQSRTMEPPCTRSTCPSNPGEIFCLLGANGAEKPTTINLFLRTR